MSSVLRTAPWRRAPILFIRQPVVALAVGATALVLGLTAAGGPLYLASVGSAAVSLQVTQRCVPQLGNDASGTGPVAGLGKAEASLSALSARSLARAGAPADAVVTPTVTMVAGDSGLGGVEVSQPGRRGSPMLAQLATRTGGLSHIGVVSRARGGDTGVWLSDDLAASMHVRAGQTVRLALTDPNGPALTGLRRVEVRVAGIYRQLVGTTLPPFWCSQTGLFGAPDSNFPPPPVVLASQSTFLSILHAAHETQVGSFTWEQPPSTSLSLPDASRLVSGLAAFTHRVGFSRGFRQALTRIGGGYQVGDFVPPQYGYVVVHAKAIQRAVRQGIVPGAVAGVAIAALLVAAAGSYWADRRRIEVALLSSRGVAPAALGLKASLEMLVPVALGTTLGWLGGIALVSGIGPSAALGAAALSDALGLALIGGLAGLALLGVVGGLRAQGRIRSPAGSRHSRWSRVPFELVGVGLAGWVWASLGHVSLEAGATSAQPVQAGYLIFPLLFLISLIVLATRLLVAGLRTRRLRAATTSSPVPLWLAVRRLAGAPQAAGVLVASVAAALGVFVYAAALTGSEEATVHAKAEIYVGADVSATINQLGRLPAPLAPSATEVLAAPNDLIGSQMVEVIGVDPQTFARGAFWDSSFAGHSLPALLGELARAARRPGPIPVIVAGAPHLSLKDGLSLAGYGVTSAPYRVRLVDTATEFPGQNGDIPVIVTTRDELNRVDPNANSEVWAHGSGSGVVADLARDHIDVTIVVASADVLDLTDFASVGWTFAYLQSLGALIGAVAVGGLLLFLTARGRARALSYVLARRMGLSRRAHTTSLAIELGTLFASGAVLGTALAWWAVELVDSHLNPLPELPPAALVEVPWAGLAISALLALAAWLLTTGWAQHVTDRSRASELLRFDD